MTENRAFEDDLALLFAPTYISSAGEDRYLAELEATLAPKVALGRPPAKPCIYYSVFKHPPRGDRDFYEINYLSIWDWDTGGLMGLFGAHQWDLERTAILVKGPAGEADASSFLAVEAYYAAHEGTSINTSSYQKPPKKENGVVVYWSLGKHASYPAHPPLFMSLVDQIRPPEGIVEPPGYVLKNAGTPDNPSDLAPWINYREDWGPDRISSVYSKLMDPLWTPKSRSLGWQQSWPATLKAQSEVMHLQEAFNIQPSGILDPALFANLRDLSPDLIRNAPLMDRDLLARAVRFRPTKLDTACAALPLKGDVNPRSLMAPKSIQGRMAGTRDVKAVNLGQLPGSEMILYGLMRPEEKEIFEVMVAPMATITKSRLSSSDLICKRSPIG